LPNFKYKIEELKNDIDYWAYFLKNSSNMKEIPLNFPLAIKNASEKAKISNLSNNEIKKLII